MRISLRRSRKSFAVGVRPLWMTLVARLLIILVSLQVLWADPSFASQIPPREPLGSLSATGEVYVNEARASGEVTLFAGDSLRTGADGAASVTFSGRGMLIVANQTEVSFAPSPRYFAELRHGVAEFRTLAGATNFELRTGNFIVVPVSEPEAAADIERAPDGTTKITCTKGSMGVISLEGPESIFLHPGEGATISPDGRLSTTAPQAPAPQPGRAPSETPPPPGQKKKHTGLIILGLVGGGVAGAAAALASRGGKAAVSSSTP